MTYPRLADVLSAPSGRPPLRSEVTLRAAPDEFIERHRRRVASAAVQAPTTPHAFVDWFVSLKETGAGQRDTLFRYLEEQASLFEMRWFLNQEIDGEHGSPLNHTARSLGLDGSGPVAEVRGLRRLIAHLRDDPRHAFRCAGALAATALTAPGRARSIHRGLRRLGVTSELPIRAEPAWDPASLRPLVQARPEHATAVAEGALMRLRAGARCYERYRREFGFVEPLERRVMLVADDHHAGILAP